MAHYAVYSIKGINAIFVSTIKVHEALYDASCPDGYTRIGIYAEPSSLAEAHSEASKFAKEGNMQVYLIS